MNRLVLVSDDTVSASTVAGHENHHEQLSTRQRRTGLGFDLPYSTFAPIHYEPGYAYPLVVWLHDSDSNERELSQIMPLVSMRNYVAIAPRGTCELKKDRGRYGWRQSADAIESAQSRIAECVAVAK